MSYTLIDILDLIDEYETILRKYNALDPEDILEKAEDGSLPISEAIIIYNRLKDIEEIYPQLRNMRRLKR